MTRRINIGESEADARYAIEDSSGTGGDLRLLDVSGASPVEIATYEYAAGEWVFAGGITQGEDPAETVSGAGSSLQFTGNDTRDVHDATDVALSNSSGASVTEDVTVDYYEGVDSTGALLASETQSVTLADGASTTATFLTGDFALSNTDYYVEATTTNLTTDGIDENTLGAQFTIDQTAEGDQVVTDHYGTERARYDSLTDEFSVPSLGVEQIENVHYLPAYPGNTLDAKWDDLRSEFSEGESEYVVIPPADDPSLPEVTTIGDDNAPVWKVENPMVIDDPENKVRIDCNKAIFASTGPIGAFWRLSPTNKTEEVHIDGGMYFNHNDNVNGEIIDVRGGSRVYIDDITTNQSGSTSTMPHAIRASASTAIIGGLRIRRLHDKVSDTTGSSILVESNTNRAAHVTIRDVAVVGDSGIKCAGDLRNIWIEGVNANNDGNAIQNRVVELDTNSDGRCRKFHVAGVNSTATGVAGVVTNDSGSQSRHAEVTIEKIRVSSGETIADIGNCDGAVIRDTISDEFANRSITVASSSVDTRIIAERGDTITLNDSGTRTTLNGLGTNSGDPSSTGDWNGFGYEGLLVRDTTNSNTHLYNNGTWSQIAST